MMQINVGLIGFGMSGQVFHAPIINGISGLKLHKVTARKAAQQEILRSRYPASLVVNSAEEIILAPDIDLVVIATSNDVHASLAESALLAGKHVVIEKPFTIYSRDADYLIKLANERQKLLTVYHNARWNNDFLTLRKVLNTNRLGRLVTFEARYDRFRNTLKSNAWREEGIPGSGILYDLGAHLIDQALILFGIPHGIFADLRIIRDEAQAIDDFELILYYEKLKVSLKGSMLVKEPTARYALYGTKGSYVKFGIDPQEAALKEGRTPEEEPDWGSEPKENWGILHVEEHGVSSREPFPSEKGNYPAFYVNLRDAIQKGDPLHVQPEQARAVIRLIELAEESARSNKVVDYRELS